MSRASFYARRGCSGAVGVWALESDRKREILIAEARFERLQQLSARLAEAGVYVIGPLNPGLDAEPRIPDAAVIEQESPERGAAE